MDLRKLFEDLRAVQTAREGSRIQIVLNAQVIEKLGDLQGAIPVTLADAAQEVWPERFSAAPRR